MIHHESKDVQVAEKSEYGTGVWGKIDIWKMGRRRELSSDLQSAAIIMRTGNVSGRRGKAIVYKKYKEGDASLRECESPWDKDDKCGDVTIVRFVRASGEKCVSV